MIKNGYLAQNAKLKFKFQLKNGFDIHLAHNAQTRTT